MSSIEGKTIASATMESVKTRKSPIDNTENERYILKFTDGTFFRICFQSDYGKAIVTPPPSQRGVHR